MGLDLTFYEVIESDNDTHTIKEVLSLSNDMAMLATNWLYRNDDGKITGNYLNYCYIYHQTYGFTLLNMYKNLKKVVEADSKNKDTYALFYFPALYTVDDWISSVEMFSESYYATLRDLYKVLDDLLFGDDSPAIEMRQFFYNISW